MHLAPDNTEHSIENDPEEETTRLISHHEFNDSEGNARLSEQLTVEVSVNYKIVTISSWKQDEIKKI